ncbi:ABC transporter permease [Alkalibacterium iburiense]|uniref:ABC transporter permease n=1 Tax=Alkalibacterium iburiense TaxID=290589 RepID=A0ABP3HH75_9LACT
MNITHLFQKRKSIYYKRLSKFLKYILNDHFVLALLLLVGALGFTYSEYIETVSSGAVLPRVVLLLLIVGILPLGRIRTLIEPADTLFLLPKEEELNRVMFAHLRHSLLFFSIMISIIGFMSIPLLAATNEWNTLLNVYWIGTLIVWKSTYLLLNYNYFKEYSDKRQRYLSLTVALSSVLGLSVSLFYSMLLGLVFSVITLISYIWGIFYKEQRTGWNWENLIQSEKKRVQGIYRLINLFVETPYQSNKVRRFKVLDWFIKSLKADDTPYTFYLARVFVRNTAFSGLYLRLAIIAGLFIYFTDSVLINILMSVLFLYLIGFQLLPLKQIIQQSITFKLYPGSDTDKIKAIQKLLLYLLSIVAVLFAIVSFNGEWESVLMTLVANALFVAGFVYVYSPKRLSSV